MKKKVKSISNRQQVGFQASARNRIVSSLESSATGDQETHQHYLQPMHVSSVGASQCSLAFVQLAMLLDSYDQSLAEPKLGQSTSSK